MQRTILRNLERAHNGMMATGTLWSECQLDQGGASYSDFKKALTELEIKEQIVIVTGEDRNKAKITDAGRARMLEQ
jgi:fructose-1-phosphate kinase PfkB-like protein